MGAVKEHPQTVYANLVMHEECLKLGFRCFGVQESEDVPTLPDDRAHLESKAILGRQVPSYEVPVVSEAST